MFELHSNFTFEGSKTTVDGVRARRACLARDSGNHAGASTTGSKSDSTSLPAIGGPEGYQWVGDHIRPRVRAPESWHWPVGVSLSTEIGYQRRSYSPDTWTWEIRPIVDKQMDRWYFGVNPALERSFHGLSVHQGVGFRSRVSRVVTM